MKSSFTHRGIDESHKGKELKETAEFLWEVVEETRDHALTLLDPEGRIVSWHDGARVIVHARLFEVSPPQAAIAASTTACSTLLEATSRACMARPSTTVV